MINLKNIRQMAGKTEFETAQILHRSLRHYRDIENGKRILNAYHANKLAEYFNTTVAEITKKID